MEVAESSSPTEEEEEEEEEEGEEPSPEPRPRTRSNPEGAEDRAPGAQASVGSRSEGEGEASSAEDGAPGAPSGGPKPWQVPPAAPEVQVRTPRVNCPEKVVICLDLSEEMSLPKLQSFNGSRTNALNVSQKMIEMFVRTKHKIDKSHEFALVVVSDDTAWLSGLTSDPRELCSCLYDLDTASCSTFNLEGLFSLMTERNGEGGKTEMRRERQTPAQPDLFTTWEATPLQPAEDGAAQPAARADHPPALRGAGHPAAQPAPAPAAVLTHGAHEEDAPVPLLLLRRDLHPQWCRRGEGGGHELEGHVRLHGQPGRQGHQLQVRGGTGGASPGAAQLHGQAACTPLAAALPEPRGLQPAGRRGRLRRGGGHCLSPIPSPRGAQTLL